MTVAGRPLPEIPDDKKPKRISLILSFDSWEKLRALATWEETSGQALLAPMAEQWIAIEHERMLVNKAESDSLVWDLVATATTIAKVANDFKNEGMSVEEIAAEMDADVAAVQNWLDEKWLAKIIAEHNQ